MNAVLLRIARYRASLELTDPEQLIEQEFRTRDGEMDLRLSTYEFPGTDSADRGQRVVQVHAEHSASLLRDPPRGQRSIDLAGLRANIATTRGETKFRFTTKAHRELVLADGADLRDLVVALLQGLHDRTFDVTKAAVIGYAAQRVLESDPEWVAALDAPERNEWRRQVSATANLKTKR